MKFKSKGKVNKEQPIITEENDAYATVQDISQTQDVTIEQPIENDNYAMVQDTSQTQDNVMEQPIVTEGNTAYGMAGGIGTAVQPTTSFDQQQQNNEQSAAGEPVYEAIPTGETTEESEYDYPKFSSNDPDYICI